MSKYIKTLFLALLAFTVQAQVPQPADPQEGPIAIVNATAHLGNGQVIEQSVVAFDQGKLTVVADASTRPDLSGHRVIEAEGKHVYPGFILPKSTLGLVDINAVRPTRDFAEVGEFTPHVRSLIAYNTDSELIAALRFNGILLAQSTPTGGRISGTSSIMMLEGWNWEDAAYRADDGIHLSWPALSFGARWWLGETGRRKNDRYADQVSELLTFLRDAKSYHKKPTAKKNLLLEATRPLFTGEKQLFVEANNAAVIVEAINSLKATGVQKIVLVGGRDAWHVKDLLVQENIPVLLNEVHSRPNRDDEDIDLHFRMPGILTDAGVKVGLMYRSLQSSRNLPFFAGSAVAYGMEKEEALKLITSNTAEILGIGDRAGTLEVGKDAILFVSQGDALDMRTSKVEMAFVQGKELELVGKQQVLFNRFKEKYEKGE
ncbi:MAG: amidohydrolase family protein [Cytophagales bacterium]|nr:amidohydrolase family protein [Cytophagales bacterium]